MTTKLAEELAAFLPEAASLTPAELAECAAQPEPEPAPKAVGPDVDFAGAGSPILAALNEDSITDSMMVYHVPRTKSLRFKWRDKAFDGVTAVRATEEGFVVTTSDGAKLVRPVDGAKAEVVDHTVTTKAESHQAAADTASDRTGTTPTNSIGKAISAYLGR